MCVSYRCQTAIALSDYLKQKTRKPDDRAASDPLSEPKDWLRAEEGGGGGGGGLLWILDNVNVERHCGGNWSTIVLLVKYTMQILF